MVEEKADGMLAEARSSDVAFLVVGDPFGYGDSGFRLFRFWPLPLLENSNLVILLNFCIVQVAWLFM